MGGKVLFKYLLFLTLAWLIIVLYMGKHLYQLVEESQKSALKLEIMTQETEFLKKENIELHRETNIRNIRAINDDLERITKVKLDKKEDIDLKQWKGSYLGHQHDSRLRKIPDIEYEQSRRRINNYVVEMLYFVTSKVKKLQRMTGEAFDNDKLENFNKNIMDLSLVTLNELDKLAELDGMNQYRMQAFVGLRTVVQNRLHNLQNPTDCKKARRLVCSLNKGCGFGCQMHHIIYCMIVAYVSNRTMVINSRGWRYSKKGWESLFLPVSETCKNVDFGSVYWGKPYNTDSLVVHLPIIDSLYPRPPQLPQAVPKDLLPSILQFHETPFHWWVGQLCGYLFRYQPSITEKLEAKRKELGFESPIVGIHVRRTDKIGIEAEHHDIEEYMQWAKMYFDRLELSSKITTKRIYLATDDKQLLSEAVTKYPDYKFVSDKEASKLADLDHRYTEASLHGVVTDIHFLSEADYLVCTFSSQVCRLAYEVMSSKHPDASKKYHSLDDIYYFGGQKEHKVRTRFAHKSVHNDEIDLEVGDELAIYGNHWDGYSKGLSHKTHLDGTFPSFKVEEVIDEVDFPKY